MFTIDTVGEALFVRHTPVPAQPPPIGLDRPAWPELVGTLAGEDSIIMALKGLPAYGPGGEGDMRGIEGDMRGICGL